MEIYAKKDAMQDKRRKRIKEKIKSYKLKGILYRKTYRDILGRKLCDHTEQKEIQDKWKNCKQAVQTAAA